MNQREAVAAFYGIVGIAALAIVLLIIFPGFFIVLFGSAFSLLAFASLCLAMQVRREHIVRTQERLAKEKEEKVREEQRKQALLKSIQRDSDYLEELKRARGETRY